METVPSIDALLTALASSDSETARRAVDTLARQGRRVIGPLSKTLHRGSPLARVRAAEALGSIGGGAVVRPLIRALGDRESDVRVRAAAMLGTIGARRATRPLLRCLHHKDAATRRWAALALGEIKAQAACKPLMAALGDKDVNVRQAAVKALGTLGDAQAIPALAALLTDQAEVFGRVGQVAKPYPLRAFVAEALREFGTAEALEALRAHGFPAEETPLEDSDEDE